MQTGIDLAQVAARFSATNPDGYAELARALLLELVAGRPVSPSTLARSVGWSIERVAVVLDGSPSTEYDNNGAVVGYGLTLRETPHACEIDGRRLYAWCALDTLMFPAWIGSTARVVSTCAVTGAPIFVTVTPDGVRDVEPADAMLSLVPPDILADVRRGFCCHVHFFASAAAAEAWRTERKSVTVVSVREAFVLGQQLASRMFPKISVRSASPLPPREAVGVLQ